MSMPMLKTTCQPTKPVIALHEATAGCIAFFLPFLRHTTLRKLRLQHRVTMDYNPNQTKPKHLVAAFPHAPSDTPRLGG